MLLQGVVWVLFLLASVLEWPRPGMAATSTPNTPSSVLHVSEGEPVQVDIFSHFPVEAEESSLLSIKVGSVTGILRFDRPAELFLFRCLLVKYYGGEYEADDPSRKEFLLQDAFLLDDDSSVLVRLVLPAPAKPLRIVIKRCPNMVPTATVDVWDTSSSSTFYSVFDTLPGTHGSISQEALRDGTRVVEFVYPPPNYALSASAKTIPTNVGRTKGSIIRFLGIACAGITALTFVFWQELLNYQRNCLL
jgi:hypothetical protein